MKHKPMIYFMNDQDKLPVTYRLKLLMRRAVEASLAYEGFENACQVSLTFTDDEGIRKLNESYRGIDRPTDVLSFRFWILRAGRNRLPTSRRSPLATS